MIFDQDSNDNLRNIFCDAVVKVFGDSMEFLDFLENEDYSYKYDCFLDGCGENYIINRETGEYINWYKLCHLGRCINISAFPSDNDISRWIVDFLTKFKESRE